MPDSLVLALSTNSLEIDGTRYDFAAAGVRWPRIAEETRGAVLEANRDAAGELWITVRRFYSSPGQPSWDSGEFQEVSP